MLSPETLQDPFPFNLSEEFQTSMEGGPVPDSLALGIDLSFLKEGPFGEIYLTKGF